MNNKKVFLMLVIVLLTFLINVNVWASEIDDVIKNNIPPSVYKETRESWERLNQWRQEENRPPLPESEIIKWTYQEADLDGTKNRDYLIIAYGDYTPTYFGVVILKKENESYTKIWEDLDITWYHYAGIELDDLDGDMKPEIIIRSSTGNGKNSEFEIIKWQGSESYMLFAGMDTEFVDLDRDGVKEILDYNVDWENVEEPDGTVRREYQGWYDVYKFNGTEYVSTGEIIPNEEGHRPSLGAGLDVTPREWDLSWVNSSQPERIQTALSQIGLFDRESHSVTELNPDSVRLEDRVMPKRTYIEDGKLIAEFDKQEVVTYLLKAPRLKPLASGDTVNITISALLPSGTVPPGQYVAGTAEIKIVSSVQSILFNEFNIKHWRIDWAQGKHDKNKFQLAGKIDLPDDYSTDMLQKKGTVTIAINKKDSGVFSQSVTLDFTENGPIWRYKAPKKQLATDDPLSIEKMLIFWQPEVSQDKPSKAGKSYRKRTGWFMIQGNINVPNVDQAALLPKSSLTLNIPITASGTAGRIESSDNIDFVIKKNLWLFQSSRPYPGWKDNWWKDIKD